MSDLDLEASHFRWNCPVYYEDTDSQGFLYHARCMNYFERARTEWLRSLGVQQSGLLSQGLGFVVAKAQLSYHTPAFLDDQLIATVLVDRVRKTDLSMKQLLIKEDSNDSGAQVIVSSQFQIAFIDLGRRRPEAMPAQMLECFKVAGII